jgi:hypothetical protein
MAYGFEIQTNQGYVDVASIDVARYHYSFSTTSASGSVTVSGFDSSLGHISVIANDKKVPPKFSFNNSTKVFTWSGPTVNSTIPNIIKLSTSFRFVFWRFD